MAIDIVIPTLNEEHYIGILLESLTKQTYKDFHVFLVDGNSSDHTCEIAKRFSNKLPLTITTTSIRNVSHQRNIGAKQGSSPAILFLDADVLLNPFFLETIIQKTKNYDLANCWIQPISKKKRDHVLWNAFNILFLELGQFFWPVGIGSDLYSTRAIFTAIGGFKKELLFWEDVDYIQRAIKKHARYTILHSPKIYVSVRRLDVLGRKKLLKECFKGFRYALRTGKIPQTSQMEYPMDLDYSKLHKEKSH